MENKESYTNQPIRKSDLRQKNEKLVLFLIRKNGPVSQSKIVHLTGLRPPTILRIFNNMLSEGLIIPTKKVGTTGKDRPGRKAIQYVVNKSAFYTCGLDFYAKRVSVVIEDFGGNVTASSAVELSGNMNAYEVLFEIKKIVWATLSRADISKNSLLGFGIGSPGVVDTSTGTVLLYSRIEGMVDFPIEKEFEKTFGVSTVVHNNCSVIAQSEYQYGPVVGADSLVAFLIRGGLGGAFVKSGKAYENQGRTAFELGHMAMDFRGTPCDGKGEHGCLENWITESALVETAGLSSLAELDAAILARDASVLSRLEIPVEVLSQAVLTISNILNPEAFVIVSMSQVLSEYLANKVAARHQVDQYTSRGLPIRFVGRVFDPTLACRGAIDLVMNKFFSGEIPLPSKVVAEKNSSL